MTLKSIAYYKRLFVKRLSTIWGILTALATAFWCGFVVGRYFEENLANRQAANMQSEYTIKLVECENDHIREVVEVKATYERELMELKLKLKEYEKNR